MSGMGGEKSLPPPMQSGPGLHPSNVSRWRARKKRVKSLALDPTLLGCGIDGVEAGESHAPESRVNLVMIDTVEWGFLMRGEQG